MFEQVKAFVKKSFEKSASGSSLEHFERTVYWLKKLKPDADEPMLIVAYAHDIARAFRKTDAKKTFKNKEMNDPEILECHQKQGAHILSEFLKKHDYDEKQIKRVHNMILHHEDGGNKEADLIKDADSISYLEINAPKHVKKLVPLIGEDKVRRKIDWMFNRISSEKAKELAKPFYDKVLKMK